MLSGSREIARPAARSSRATTRSAWKGSPTARAGPTARPTSCLSRSRHGSYAWSRRGRRTSTPRARITRLTSCAMRACRGRGWVRVGWCRFGQRERKCSWLPRRTGCRSTICGRMREHSLGPPRALFPTEQRAGRTEIVARRLKGVAAMMCATHTGETKW